MTRTAVIVPWNDPPDYHRRAAKWWTDWRWAELFPDFPVVYGSGPPGPIHRAAARNQAFDTATAAGDVDVVAVFDADTVVPAAQIRAGLDVIAEQPRSWVICYGEERYYNLNEQASRMLHARDPGVDLVEPSDPSTWDHKLTSWAGALLVPVEAWREVGGYDERFVAWSYEDNAFQLALDTLWGPHVRIPGFAVAMWHPRPDACFEAPGVEANRELHARYRRAAGRPPAMRQLLGCA
jgi:hypothetical protein